MVRAAWLGRAAVLLAAALPACALPACAATVRAGDFHRAPLLGSGDGPSAAGYRAIEPPDACTHRAPPVVFLPALGLTAASWSGVIERMQACRARVAVDLPGVGESPPLADPGAVREE